MAEQEVKEQGCPKCGGEQLCPCESCAPDHPDKVMWKWMHGDAIACGHCGHTMQADEWEELDMERAWQKERAWQEEQRTVLAKPK